MSASRLVRFVSESGPVWIDPEFVVAIIPSGGNVAGICSTVWTSNNCCHFVCGSPDDIVAALKGENPCPIAS